jgi:sugar phosphate isomerase/epimerase
MRDFSQGHEWLSINTATLRKQWRLDRVIDECARRDIRAIAPWRDQVAAVGLQATARQLRDAGVVLSGYCRGGFFPAADAAGLAAALDGKPVHCDIARARAEVHDGIAATLEFARTMKMPLAIEPLHPMQAAERACINTLEQALDVCDALDGGRSGALGVAVDLYHVWWDPKLQPQIARAGRERLHAFHVCDWLTPTRDLLNDRGMMGDGVIEIRKARSWMEAAGYAGFAEVEIFSEHWWSRPGDEVLDTCIARHRSVV